MDGHDWCFFKVIMCIENFKDEMVRPCQLYFLVHQIYFLLFLNVLFHKKKNTMLENDDPDGEVRSSRTNFGYIIYTLFEN
jgi:hypothetical protein